MLVESYGESRFKLEVNWDPDTVGAFVELPAAEAHGRTLPIDPYLLEPLEHFIRLHGDRRRRRNAREALARLRVEHDAAIGAVRRSRASDGDALACEPRLGGELRPFQRAGVDVRAASRGGCSSPTSRAWARPSRRWRRWRRTTPTRRS